MEAFAKCCNDVYNLFILWQLILHLCIISIGSMVCGGLPHMRAKSSLQNHLILRPDGEFLESSSWLIS